MNEVQRKIIEIVLVKYQHLHFVASMSPADHNMDVKQKGNEITCQFDEL